MAYSNEHGKWMYNYTEDGIWNQSDFYDTKEEAIKEGLKEYGLSHETYYVGQVEDINVAPSVDAEQVLEMIGNEVYEQVGEAAEDYLGSIDKEELNSLQSALDLVLHGWITKYNYQPDYFRIINTETINTGLLKRQEEMEEELYQEAKTFVIEMQTAPTTMLQRRFRIGYTQATKLLERMEEEGIVSKADPGTIRSVLVKEL